MKLSGKTLTMLGMLLIVVAFIIPKPIKNEVVSAVIAICGGAIMLYGNYLTGKQSSKG